MSKQEIEQAVNKMVGLPAPDGVELEEKAGDLLALVGKGKDDNLTQKDAREIGRKVARMSGARQKSYLGMIKALGGYYKGKGAGTAKLVSLRKTAMRTYNTATGKEEEGLQEQVGPSAGSVLEVRVLYTEDEGGILSVDRVVVNGREVEGEVPSLGDTVVFDLLSTESSGITLECGSW